jgi:hypothetical protein
MEHDPKSTVQPSVASVEPAPADRGELRERREPEGRNLLYELEGPSSATFQCFLLSEDGDDAIVLTAFGPSAGPVELRIPQFNDLGVMDELEPGSVLSLELHCWRPEPPERIYLHLRRVDDSDVWLETDLGQLSPEGAATLQTFSMDFLRCAGLPDDSDPNVQTVLGGIAILVAGLRE